MPAQKKGTHLPPGCDAETSGAVETALGTVHVRIRRWPFDAGRYTRHEVLVETPRARAAHEGYTPIGDAEDLDAAPVGDMLTAMLRASRLVERAAEARVAERRGQAPDRGPVRTDRRGPDAAPDAEPAGPGQTRPKPPRRYANAGHRLHAVLGAAGVARARHYAVASDVVGRPVASLSDLSPSEAALVEGSVSARGAALP